MQEEALQEKWYAVWCLENHKDGYIHNMATTKMNYEMEFPILGKKLNSFQTNWSS